MGLKLYTWGKKKIIDKRGHSHLKFHLGYSSSLFLNNYIAYNTMREDNHFVSIIIVLQLTFLRHIPIINRINTVFFQISI